MNLDARLSLSQAAQLAGVSKQLVNWWRSQGKLKRGEDGLYRAGDVLAVERDTRRSPYSSRSVA